MILGWDATIHFQPDIRLKHTHADTRAGQIQELPDYTEAVAWLDDVSSCIFLVI